MNHHSQVLIVGGGTAGLTVAALLRNRPDPPEVTILEPSDSHYYQPLWTLVGGGVFAREESRRDEEGLIPGGVARIVDAAAAFEPERQVVVTRSGSTLRYDHLVVAVGIQVDWNAVPGLADAVGRPGSGVCSNYSYETVRSTWECIRTFKGGVAVFTEPGTAVKCGGAPQKIMYLADDYFRRSGVRSASRVIFASAKSSIFAVEKYATALGKVVARKDIETRFNQDLKELRPEDKEAVLVDVATGAESTITYDMIHVTPPMSAPEVVKRSALGNSDGWVDVDAGTLQHVRYPNVFALGDCSSLPTSKTGAAIHKQAPVLVENLLAHREGRAMAARYDGYTSCPLVTGYGRLILAEFDYAKQPRETFPFDQAQERYSMYALKAYALPRFYWHGMLRGRL